MLRRDKLSTTETSYPRADRCSEVGQPQNPSPPKTMTLMGTSAPILQTQILPERASVLIQRGRRRSTSIAMSGRNWVQRGQYSDGAGILNQYPSTISRVAAMARRISSAVTCCPLGCVL